MPHHGVDPHRPPTAELQLQLFRIYASTSRQREWFRIHEENAKALLKMTESLHQRFFPGEPSPFRPPHDHDNDHRDDGGHGTHRAASITGVFTAPGQTATVKVKGLGDEECFVSLPPLLPGSAATDNGGPSHTSAPAFITTNETDEAVVGIYRAVPDFLLELTAEHIHECFGTEVATSAAAPSHVLWIKSHYRLCRCLLRCFDLSVMLQRWQLIVLDIPPHTGVAHPRLAVVILTRM
ncbi:hypothetical protein ERJ75_000383900 [Trypanosoma vivax]|nr:hypothetical protein ERJ75_000383900 [Trypanosoma vivax]